MRPFSVVKDRGFQSLMKTGRPGYYIPSPATVSRDVKIVFVKSRQRIAEMLQVSKLVTTSEIIITYLFVESRWNSELRNGCLDLTKP
jgi:hypothetical protein